MSNSVNIRGVALVKSPLQFLNALEACHHFGLSPQECLLVLMADRKSLPQLQALLTLSPPWGGVVPLVSSGLNPGIEPYDVGRFKRHPLWGNDIFGIVKLANLASRLVSLEVVLIGDLENALMRHFAQRARADKVVVMDDGVATLRYAAWRVDGARAGRPRLSKRVGSALKHWVFGLRDTYPSQLTFFSVYDVTLPEQDCLEKNDYGYLRKSIQEVPVDDVIYVLGGPLVEAEILTESEYLWHLEAMARELDGQRVVYVAHRRESPERVSQLGKHLGWQTCLFDYPIEFQLAVVGPRPRILVSLLSSALENCSRLFGEQLPIRSYRLSRDHFAAHGTPRGAEIKALYAHYTDLQTTHFKVCDLEA
ncbi:MAG: hypothetical protein C0624_02930 [Desulfuromonas sp.]|nr:MAG: hypothetical protein C0624_02930 [Desulfuromonas sp.]